MQYVNGGGRTDTVRSKELTGRPIGGIKRPYAAKERG